MHNAPSVAAMVASHDRTYAQWPASIRLNPREEGDSRQVREDVEHLGSMILERLDQFKKENNNQLPERIVIYRDGLSESQFAMAVDTELGRILVGLRSLYGTAIPNILLVCAVKSHDTRLFPLQLTKTQRRKDDDYQIHDNPAVGTVVYDTVTYGEGQDFFLYSQNAMQVSTLRPTRYVVLFNNDQTVSIEDVAKMVSNTTSCGTNTTTTQETLTIYSRQWTYASSTAELPCPLASLLQLTTLTMPPSEPGSTCTSTTRGIMTVMMTRLLTTKGSRQRFSCNPGAITARECSTSRHLATVQGTNV